MVGAKELPMIWPAEWFSSTTTMMRGPWKLAGDEVELLADAVAVALDGTEEGGTPKTGLLGLDEQLASARAAAAIANSARIRMTPKAMGFSHR